ncbi:hypothetical protein ACFL27_24710 [candidate division CSSED10-310 bacterium]|uniref:Uncharacterized protein n=1 Tax=candidate division CSSED10-310 bacterium TaxID=2855610 RepID=A0ABV6Z4X9_UNCC1
MNQEEMFLREINARLPKNIDWKKGACLYIKQIIEKEGEHNKRYHLIKPFVGGPDFGPFFND